MTENADDLSMQMRTFAYVDISKNGDDGVLDVGIDIDVSPHGHNRIIYLSKDPRRPTDRYNSHSGI